MKNYLAKVRGGAKGPPSIRFREIMWSWTGSAIGIGICGYVSSEFFETKDLPLLIGSFGASAVLLYGAPASPLAQPRNLVGGHIISGFVGVACYRLSGSPSWLSAALAVSFAIVLYACNPDAPSSRWSHCPDSCDRRRKNS